MSLSRSMAAARLLRAQAQPSSCSSLLFVRAASTSAGSTASAAADKAKEAASTVQDKASSTADAAKSSAASAAQRSSEALNSIGNRVGGLLGAYREPLVNNILVVREMGKQIYIQEKLQPPTNPQAIREAYEEFYHSASSGAWWRSIIESGQWKRVLLYAAEAYGIFTIGEMIGRRHIVGYKIDH